MSKQFRLTFIPCIFGDVDPFRAEFNTFDSAQAGLDLIANYTLLLHKTSIMPGYTNYGVIECLDENGEWVEMED